MGIECGNQEYRREVLLRAPTNANIIESFEDIAHSGIAFSLNLIIGMPGETRDSRRIEPRVRLPTGSSTGGESAGWKSWVMGVSAFHPSW